MSGSTAVAVREFPSLKDATEFANKQPIETVLEIKHYDYKASNVQD